MKYLPWSHLCISVTNKVQNYTKFYFDIVFCNENKLWRNLEMIITSECLIIKSRVCQFLTVGVFIIDI